MLELKVCILKRISASYLESLLWKLLVFCDSGDSYYLISAS